MEVRLGGGKGRLGEDNREGGNEDRVIGRGQQRGKWGRGEGSGQQGGGDWEGQEEGERVGRISQLDMMECLGGHRL